MQAAEQPDTPKLKRKHRQHPGISMSQLETPAANATIVAWKGRPTWQLIRHVTEVTRAGAGDGVTKWMELIASLQETTEGSPTFGQFPMTVGARPGDLNAVLFLVPQLIELDISARAAGGIVQEHAARILRRATVAAEARWDEEVFDPHRDFKLYTNVFLLYVRAMLMLGRHRDEARLVRKGLAQWKRWYFHFAYHGLDEFASPTYHGVDVEALRAIRVHAPDESVRNQATRTIEFIAAFEHAITHPRFGLFVCGSARHYRDFSNTIDKPDLTHWKGDHARDVPDAVKSEFDRRVYPFRASGRAGARPFLFSTWQSEHSAVGSMTGGNYFWQQIHWMAAVGNSPIERAVAWMPGTLTPTSGHVCQRDNAALCVFHRLPHSFHRTQSQVSDEQVRATLEEYGIGVQNNWAASRDEHERYLFRAHAHVLVVQPFVLRSDRIERTTLSMVERSNIGQVIHHSRPNAFTEWVFATEPLWFGCLVTLVPDGQIPEPATVTFSRDEAAMKFTTSAGLNITLFVRPSGEVVELLNLPMAQVPLLNALAGVIHPGDILVR